jgi:hypothetical protein
MAQHETIDVEVLAQGLAPQQKQFAPHGEPGLAYGCSSSCSSNLERAPCTMLEVRLLLLLQESCRRAAMFSRPSLVQVGRLLLHQTALGCVTVRRAHHVLQ